MRRFIITIVAGVIGGLAVSSLQATTLSREAVIGRGAANQEYPTDMLRPEGRTRWSLTGLKHRDRVTLRLVAEGTEVTLQETIQQNGSGMRQLIRYSDIDGSDDAVRWFFPDHFSETMRPGLRQTYEFDETGDKGLDRLRIEARTVGIGWVHLPSGPREAVLQRALVSRAIGGGRHFKVESFVHRWIDPRAGVVAEVTGPATPDGRGRTGVADARTLEVMMAGASMLKIHVSEISASLIGKDILYGFDVGNTPISALDPNGYTTIGELAAQDYWDFSGNTTGTEVAYTVAAVDPNQTCNTASCGYSDPNALLQRNDTGFDAADPDDWTKINTVVVTEDRGTDITMWLRAGSIKEGVTGTFGEGETRICYETFGGVTRTEVPLWRFSHLDPNGTERYFQAGDTWSSGVFNCEQNLFNEVCGGGGLFSTLYSAACGTHTGTQFTNVIKGGVVTLPSGHTFNSLLTVTAADFCVYLFAGCGIQVDSSRTVNYLWQVPYLGSVVRLESEQIAPDLTSWTNVVETNISYGLFPPRSIMVTGSTDTTISISWDPGLITNRISGYKVYWDSDSGSSSGYSFNSVDNAGQVSFGGTSATISGLTPGTDYYVTVTSLSDFPPNPATPFTPITYESLLYPTTVSGDPSFVYPTEVLAMTTGGVCVPTTEVNDNIVVDHDPAGIEICWDTLVDPCVSGYRVLGSLTADSDAGFGPVADVAGQSCWTGNPSEIYYLLVGTGTGGEGPWGHYGH